MQHFILEKDISSTSIRIDDKELLHQMKDVLRFKIGGQCIVSNGDGLKAKGEIKELNRKFAIILLSEHEACERPKRAVRLYCALSKKPSTFEMIVQKATELGVTDIIPLVTERTQVDYVKKIERLKLITREAAEQCERCFLPTLHEVQAIAKLGSEKPDGILLVGEPWKYKEQLRDITIPPNEDVNIVIGPEGGLTDEELAFLDKIGARIFLLGEHILRMETAAIATLSVVQFS